MEQKKTVLVLFGGQSSEHEISRISAASVLEHIDRDKYTVKKAGITKNGRWLLTDADTESIRDGSWERNPSNRSILIGMDRVGSGVFASDGDSCERVPVDIAFPVLHGKNGEDGTIQGLFHMAGIPFVGSGPASSAACMDKGMTKALISQAEAAKQAKCCILHRSGLDPGEAAEAADVFFGGAYPLFVKPARAGSSVGISKVSRRGDLESAVRTAFAEDSKIIVEEAIFGRELEVAVLGNDEPAASLVGEIFSAGEFYDYESKYQDEQSRTAVADDLPAQLAEEIRETAIRIYRIMECRGLARVDFFLQEDGTVVFNEINTMPGFTSISMYPSLWVAAGLEYDELITYLIEYGLRESEK